MRCAPTIASPAATVCAGIVAADTNSQELTLPQEGRQIAVVTGGASGIGLACVKRLVEDGFFVYALDRDTQGGVLSRQMADSGRVECLTVDLTVESATVRVFADLPSITALINCAGILHEAPFHEVETDDFRRLYEVNVIGMFVASREASRKMRPGSKIVNIASFAYLGTRNNIQYASSKGAVVSLTRSAALELMPLGIDVNAIAPGMIDTPMLNGLTAERRAATMAAQPAGRPGLPEDVANGVSFFASPRTRFITGQVLLVDGGKSLGRSVF